MSNFDKNKNITHDYDDIINLPHPTSKNHPRMSMHQRAAQFAPFSALNGHAAAIKETARLTELNIELSEQEKLKLNQRLQTLIMHIKDMPTVRITHFVNDQIKSGGAYISTEGRVNNWDEYNQQLTFDDGICINVTNILDIQGSLFNNELI